MDLFTIGTSALQYSTAAGSLIEPASSPNAFAVGAVCWQSSSIESFSAQGPTIAGLVIQEAQTIPDPGQRFAFFGYKFEVLRRQRNQLTALKVTPPPRPVKN